MRSRATAPVLGAIAVVMAAFAMLQRSGPRERTDVLVRVNGPVRIAEDDTAGTVVVFGHGATIEGTIQEQLVVIGGTADISGTVLGNLVLVDGRAVLAPSAVIGENVVLHESVLERAPGARIGGVVREQAEFALGPIVGWIFWLSLSAVVIVAGLAFAALAGRQLSEAAERIRNQPGPVVVTALIVAATLPGLAILAFLSVVGIPLGFLIAFLIGPILTLLGYIVTATWLGAAILSRWGDPDRVERGRTHPYRVVLVGIVLLQLIGLVPILGGLVLILASQLGAGALVYRLWRMSRTHEAHE